MDGSSQVITGVEFQIGSEINNRYPLNVDAAFFDIGGAVKVSCGTGRLACLPHIFQSDSSFTTFTSDASARNVFVTFDPHLSFSNHISNLSRYCFMHIRDLRRIRPMLHDFKTASTIATSIVHSKLAYRNSHFLNLDYTQTQRLQLIQNSLARAITRTAMHHQLSYHHFPQITSLAKNPRAHLLQSP